MIVRGPIPHQVRWVRLIGIGLVGAVIGALLCVGSASADEGGNLDAPPRLGAGDVQLGASRTSDINIHNVGRGAVNLSGLPAVSGDDWYLDTSGPTDCGDEVPVLAADAYCSIGIRFAPTATGSRPGQVVVNSDDSQGPRTIALQGTGTPHDALTVTPATLDFGSAPVNGYTSGRQLTIRNQSATPTTAQYPQITGPFRVSSTFSCPRGWAPSKPVVFQPDDDPCTVSLEFVPSAEGPQTGTFTLGTDTDKGTISIPLSGSGTPSGPIPTITSATPSSGPSGTRVVLRGTNLAAVTVAAVDSSGVPFTVNANGTSLSLRVPAYPNFSGAVPIRLQTATGVTAQTTFTYTAQPAPTVTDPTPASGPATGNTPLKITGTSLVNVQAVTVDGGGVAFSTSPNGTSLSFRTPAHPAGTVLVEVMTSAGTASTNYTYLPTPAPTLTGPAPTSGPSKGNTAVKLTGTNLVDVQTVVVDQTPVTFTSAANGKSVTFRSPAHAAGTVPVTVTTATGSASTSFTFVQPAPTLRGPSPASGPGNTTVKVTGANLTGATSLTIGGTSVPFTINAAGTSVSFRSPAHASGPVTIVITTPAGSASTTFTYT